MEVVGGFEFFRRGRHVTARFNSVQELRRGDLVKMAGVEIGRVEEIRLAGNRVEVSMKLSAYENVRTDSKASVKFTGFMAQNFVSLTFGSPTAPRVENGTVLESTEQPDLSALMLKLEDVAKGIEKFTGTISGDSIQNVLGPLTDFLKEGGPRLVAVLANMKAISAQILEGKGSMGKLIYDDALYTSTLSAVTNLNATAGDIKSAVEKAQRIVTDVTEGKGTLGKLTKDEALYQETTVAMSNLKEILQKINRGQGSVGVLVNDASFLKNAQMSLQKLDKATEGLEDQGPLSVLGLAITHLF
jgi:phospholipid/cholesterol/gamma-HCH transport system substrate-binding protein